MTAAFRLAAFMVSAIAIELARGAGLATAVTAGLAGGLRINPLFTLIIAGAGAALSLALPDDAATSGKVAHGLSNAPFVFLLHVLLSVAAYVAGRLARSVVR